MSDYNEFWTRFLNKAADSIRLYRDVPPTNKSWLHTKPGSFHKFGTCINTKESSAWVEICFQEKSLEESNQKFDLFL